MLMICATGINLFVCLINIIPKLHKHTIRIQLCSSILPVNLYQKNKLYGPIQASPYGTITIVALGK